MTAAVDAIEARAMLWQAIFLSLFLFFCYSGALFFGLPSGQALRPSPAVAWLLAPEIALPSIGWRQIKGRFKMK